MLLCALLSLLPAARAYPSYGHKIPNGLRVAAAPEQIEFGEDNDMENWFKGAALYFNQPDKVAGGVGHFMGKGRGGLNVFGADWKEAGYQWTQELCMKDSDGDGFTNGEELGDPCCRWRWGSTPGEYMENHKPSHPGFPRGVPEEGIFRAKDCKRTRRTDLEPKILSPEMKKFYPNEEQRYFDIKVDNYEIPVQETIYVKMGFNLKAEEGKDEGVEKFHAVWADVMPDHVEHLHHLVAFGCSEYYKPEHESVALEVYPPTKNWDGKSYSYETLIDTSYVPCDIYLGGWAPGSNFITAAPMAGIAFGSDLKSINIDIHYTNENFRKGVITNDAIRIYYTPTLREHDMGIAVPFGVGTRTGMEIPSGHTRRVTTGSCTVQMMCPQDDESADIMESGEKGSEEEEEEPLMEHCPTGEELHFMDEGCTEFDGTAYCKMTDKYGAEQWCHCGGYTFETGRRRRMEKQFRRRLKSEEEPKKKKECKLDLAYSNFHGHSIATEMYLRLEKKDGRVIDVGSMPYWDFDDQVHMNLQGKNITIEEGDKMQCSCVHDSSKIDHTTYYGLGTFDEMCFCVLYTYPGDTYMWCSTYNGDDRTDPQLLKDRVVLFGDLDESDNGFDIGGPNDPFEVEVSLSPEEGNYDRRTVVTPVSPKVDEAWVGDFAGQHLRKLEKRNGQFVFVEKEGDDDKNNPSTWKTYCENINPTSSPTIQEEETCGESGGRLKQPRGLIKLQKVKEEMTPCLCSLMCGIEGGKYFAFKHSSKKPCKCYEEAKARVKVKARFEGKFTSGAVHSE